MMLSWLCLAGAAIGNAAGTYALARSGRLRRPWPSTLAIAAYLLAIVLFTLALDGISTSVAEAVFAAAGTTLVTVVGVVLLQERLGVRKAVGLGLLLVGVVVLQLQGS
jgi:small multidrug resistance pump